MGFETIKRNTAPQMIIEQILEALRNGDLQPGDRLPPERELCKMFGVGRSSIREAIKALVVMGNLQVIQGKGTFICSGFRDHNKVQLENLFAAMPMLHLIEARKILECQVASLAAERAKNKHIIKMKKIISKMEECQDNIRCFLDADMEFHETIAVASQNIVIHELMKVFQDKILDQWENIIAISYRTKDRSIYTSHKIATQIAEGNGEKASEWMLKHLNLISENVVEAVVEEK